MLYAFCLRTGVILFLKYSSVIQRNSIEYELGGGGLKALKYICVFRTVFLGSRNASCIQRKTRRSEGGPGEAGGEYSDAIHIRRSGGTKVSWCGESEGTDALGGEKEKERRAR